MQTTMDLLIEKINELQDICNDNNVNYSLDLPQIVVIGSQSSGKSSVLENIVGRDFLPRGTGIVTRRPLIIQLIYSREAKEEYVVFNHLSNQIFTDFEAVKIEIVEETNRVIKQKTDVSHLPITLKLFSSKVLSLTLVDLPGLVKVPTGDQPKNISIKIEEMCKKYVTNKNAIILAVSAANIDISNSDALHLAKMVDCCFDRTIGVLTKVDLMDKGTDVVDILAGKIIPLRLGFVPIINRGQNDVKNNKNIKQALEDEKIFFETHTAYKRNYKYCGTPYLVTKLNNILHEHIKKCLPDLREKITLLLADNQNELMNLGFVNLTPKETILKIINDITKKFSEVLKGENEVSVNELSGGARLNYTFHSHFSKFISGLGALDNIKDEHIRTVLYNSSGSSSVLLFAHTAFEKLVKISIAALKPHSLKLVSVVFSEMVKIIHQIAQSINLSRFPELNDKIISTLITLFKQHTDATHTLVGAFIDWNSTYISTRHPDFIKWNDVINKEIENRETLIESKEQLKKEHRLTFDSLPNTLRISGSFTEQETIEIGMIKSLVVSYFEIIKKIVVDQVPKAIMSELVKKAEGFIQETLFKNIYECENADKMVNESSEAVERRKVLEKNVKALKQAYDIMCSI